MHKYNKLYDIKEENLSKYKKIFWTAYILGRPIKKAKKLMKRICVIFYKEVPNDEKSMGNAEKDDIWEKLRKSVVYCILLRKLWREYLRITRKLLDKLYMLLCQNDYIDVFLFSFRVYRKTNKIFKVVPIIGIKEYCKKNKLTYIVVEEEKEREVLKAKFWNKSREICSKFPSSERYIANIRNAEIIGESTVLIAEGYLLNDMIFNDSEDRIDMRDNSLKKVWNNEAVIAQYDNKQECNQAINLINVATFNYYHALIEVLSKLLIVDQYEEYGRYPILVDEIILKIPQLKEALDIINYKNHPIIGVAKDEKWLVSNLIQISGGTWLPLNVYHRDMFKMSDFMISEKYLLLLREHILKVILKDKENIHKNRKIFISRKNTKTVRLKNEEKIRKLFEKKGFEIIYTEEMTFGEQVECFNNASCVVSATGAALTNIIFCRPGTEIVCIMPKEFQFETYSTIAYMLGLIPIFLDANVVERTPYIAADTYVVEEGYARKFIEEYVGEGNVYS